MKRSLFRIALLDTVPVMTGYLCLGLGFGILLTENGYGPVWAFFMSLFIYAGSMQYMAVSLLAGGVSLLTAAVTTLLVNARHLFYGISLIDAYKGAGKKKPYLIFALTDETYSLVSSATPPPEVDRQKYFLAVSMLDHSYWITGCVLGSLAGTYIPLNYEGIDFALTALFVTIFVDQWLHTKDHSPALIGAASTAVCLLLFGGDIFLIPSMLLIAALLTISRKVGKEAAHG